LFKGDSDGGFARCGEAREPYCEALLTAQGGADCGGERTWVEGDVAVYDVWSVFSVRDVKSGPARA
jgi:hypothetical protein